MIRTLNEKEFISLYGERRYESLCRACYNHMITSPEYRNNLPILFSLMMFKWGVNDEEDGNIIIEATIKKIESTDALGNIGRFDDFGIVSMKLTDEEFPDEIADRYNDISKIKDKFNKENNE